MQHNWKIYRLAVVCMFCVIFGPGLAFGTISIPEKLKAIPIYQGSKVLQAMDMDSSVMLTAKVDAKIDAVADFYKNTMQEKGWKISFQAEQENAKMIQLRKGNELLQISISNEKGDEATTYTLMLSTQK